MTTATLFNLQEQTFSRQPHRVDRDAGVIFGVKVLGVTSKNGRTYSPKALAAAARLYEGIEVNIDHPDRNHPGRERGIRESFGVLRNVAVRDDGVYADLHFVRAHDLAGQIAERAERFPDKLGLSHNARGQVARRGDRQVVENIEFVRSVDIVTRPATVKGLFESERNHMQNRSTETLLEPIDDSGGRPLLLETDEEPGTSDTSESSAVVESDSRVRSAFRTAVIAAFDDEALDMPATLGRIREVLAAHDSVAGGVPSETAESYRIVELESRLALMESEKEARALLEAEGVDATDEFIEAVALLESPVKKAALKPAAEQIQEFAADGSLAIDVGDLMYHTGDDARPAGSQADQGSEVLNQELFAANFIGVANSARLASQSSAGVVRVQTDGLYEFTCTSSTFEIGDLVGADEASGGTALEDQSVKVVTDPNLAIGVVVKRYATATTKVWCRLIGRVSDRLPREPYVPSAAQQALSGAGAVNVTSYYTAWTTTGTDAGTLADGLRAGQLKKIQLIVDGGDGTLTPANLSGGTTITFADAGDYAILRWDGTNWVAIELGNGADGATAPVLA
eukprot:g33076.t1